MQLAWKLAGDLSTDLLHDAVNSQREQGRAQWVALLHTPCRRHTVASQQQVRSGTIAEVHPWRQLWDYSTHCPPNFCAVHCVESIGEVQEGEDTIAI